MNVSFELLSTMSPKVDKHVKPIKKLPTVLSLKKYFRKSSLCPARNESVITIDSSYTISSTVDSENSEASPIVISDSEESFSMNKSKSKSNVDNAAKVFGENDKDHCKNSPSIGLSNEKYTNIKMWVDEVNNAKQNSSLFSEVSTVYGDTNFIKPTTKTAANSTFVGASSKRFDELFKNNTNHNSSTSSVEGNGNYNDVVEDSFGNEILSNNNANIEKKDCSTPLWKGMKDLEIEDSLKAVSECESLLDNLYGSSWRECSGILPSSEPRRKKTENKTGKEVPKTERPIRVSNFYKNPYLENNSSNNLLKSLQKERFRKALESPIIKSLKNICDSDTDSDDLQPVKCNVRKYKIISSDTSSCSDNSLKVQVSTKKETVPRRSLTKSDGLQPTRLFQDDNLEKNKVVSSNPSTSSIKIQANSDINETINSLQIPKSNYKDDKMKNKEFCSDSSVPSNKPLKVQSNTDSKNNKTRKIKTSTKGKENKNENCTYSFLASLSRNVPIDKCDMSALIFRNNFKQHRNKLVAKLFKMYNENIFDNSIPDDSPIEWSDRLRETAGNCSCRKITKRTGDVVRAVKIVLSTKVLDSADRLRDTLLHEMCHAATWIVNQVADGHGPFWKAWANRAMEAYPELPPVTRCHQYTINTKYTYKCTNCGYCIGRHTKSLNTETKRCGYCYGKFEILINKTNKKGETRSVPATPKRAATGFALFVKENYTTYKTPQMRHGDVMKILGQKFADLKVD